MGKDITGSNWTKTKFVVIFSNWRWNYKETPRKVGNLIFSNVGRKHESCHFIQLVDHGSERNLCWEVSNFFPNFCFKSVTFKVHGEYTMAEMLICRRFCVYMSSSRRGFWKYSVSGSEFLQKHSSNVLSNM